MAQTSGGTNQAPGSTAGGNGGPSRSIGQRLRDHGVWIAALAAALITATAAIAAALIERGSSDRQATPSSPPATASTALQQPGPNPSSPPAPTSDSPSPDPTAGGEDTVFRSGKGVVLADNYGIDLDASEVESPDWRYSVGGRGKDVTSKAFIGRLYADSVVVDSAPNRASCQVTGYTGTRYKKDISVGTTYCVKTDQDRYARVTITAVDPDADKVTLDITVWNK